MAQVFGSKVDGDTAQVFGSKEIYGNLNCAIPLRSIRRTWKNALPILQCHDMDAHCRFALVCVLAYLKLYAVMNKVVEDLKPLETPAAFTMLPSDTCNSCN